MDSEQNKNVYPDNTNKDSTVLYGSYSRSCAQQTQRSQPFIPPYTMPVPMSNSMPQQLMYNTQNQPMYNIMYGSQSMYRNQNTSMNSFNQPIDPVHWIPECVTNSDLPPKDKYIKYDTKLKDDNCCSTRMENITYTPLSNVYKSVNKNFYYNKNSLMDSQWFYGSNYDNQKYKELPSCSQIPVSSTESLPNLEECCNDKNIKSVKYCSIQKYPETDPKLYIYPNKYENHDMYSNQQYSKVKDYPSCSQLTSTCNMYSNNSSCLEVDKKILLESCDVNTSCDIILPSSANQGYYGTHTDCSATVLDHFNVDKIDNKSNDESNEAGGESDIVVEDSEEEVSDESEDIDKEDIQPCLVCNIAIVDNQFYIITSTAPVTSYSKSLVSNKLFNILGSNKTNSNNLCSACMSLINTLDNLELQLNNIKRDLIDKYTLSLKSLKISIDTNELNNSLSNVDKINKPRVKTCNRNTKFKAKDICGIHSFKCYKCEKIFSLKKFYKYHMSKHKIKNKYLCEHCGCSFIRNSNLKIHLRKHFNFKKQCITCKKIFTHEVSFKKHDCTKVVDKNFICHICGKAFKTRTNLKEHEYFCSGKQPFNCFECDKRFTSTTKLKHHNLLKHVKKFSETCKVCGKGFVKQSDYKSHMVSHSSEKKFKCKFCDKTYKTLSNLNQHLKSHNEKLPFTCNICQKGFLRKEHLEAHINLHNGLKPFNCPICDKKFTSKKNLDSHIRVHKGTNKKKTCTICGKQISHSLEDHMRTHSNVKELECNICKMKFLTKGALSKHKKRKHENIELDVL